MLMLSHGAFVLNITGREWHSVAIDEGHEILINKQCKNAAVQPTDYYIKMMVTFLTPSYSQTAVIRSVFSSKLVDNKLESNVRSQMKALSKVSCLPLSKPFQWC